MEEHFLNNFIRQCGEEDKYTADNIKCGIWFYNKHGDCLEFHIKDEAIVAERIDEYLTIYHSENNNKVIGFQIKDVKALINKYRFDGLVVKANVQEEKIVSITALLVSMLSESQPTFIRRQGYTEALQSMPKETDNIPVSVCV